jgi:putative addiction module component (TIGR02574 family)
MTPKALRDEILRLPPEERLRLVEDIWDSLAADAGQIPVPDWHRRELDRRAAHPSPQHITSEELHARLNRSE